MAAIAVASVIAGTAFVMNATHAFGLGYGMGSERATEAQAEILGMDTEQLQTELQDKTFSEILQEQGMTEEEFQKAMEQNAIDRMRARGLSEEEIQTRLADREARMAAHQEALAELMGIDQQTLQAELQDKTVPELLDQYGVSHVDLHDSMQNLRGEFPRGGHGDGIGGFGHNQ